MSLFLGFFKDGIESQIIVDIDEHDEDNYDGRAQTSKVYPRETARNHDDNTKGLLSVAPSANNSSEDNEAIPWLEKVLMGEQIFDSFPQTTYVCILMDLLAYNYTNLNNKAFDLLVKFFNQRAMCIDLLKQVQLLEQPESIKILKKVTKISIELKNFIEVINQWQDDEKNSKFSAVDASMYMVKCRENIDFMANILVEKQKKSRSQVLEKYKRGNTSFEVIPNTGRTEEDSLVVGLTGRIKRKNEMGDKELIANSENQRLIRNLGIQNIIVHILKIGISEKQRQNSDYIDLIRAAYLFLIRFCCDNTTNQNLVGEHLDLFAKELDT